MLWWPVAAVLQVASPQGQPTALGTFGRLDQEVRRLLGDIMRESRGRLRCASLACPKSAPPVLPARESPTDWCHGHLG